MKNTSKRLSPVQRSIVKKAITSHKGWPDYMATYRINSSKLDSTNIFNICDTFNIDVDALLTAHIAKARAGNAAFSDAAKGKAIGGEVDWQRVRKVARDEVERHAKPVYIDRVIIDQGGVKTKVDAGELTHPQFATLLTALSCVDFSGGYVPTMLIGPSGTGKTYACAQAAKALGIGFEAQGTATEAETLVGYEKLTGEQKLTPFLVAFVKPCIFLADEMDSWEPAALLAMNSAIANGYLYLSDGTRLDRHPEFRFVAATNTSGLGGDHNYSARQKMDVATLSRLSVRIAWGFDAAIVRKIASAKGGAVGEKWASEVIAVRDAFERLDLPQLADQRTIEAGTALLLQGLPADTVRELTYQSILDNDQKLAVANIVPTTSLY